MSMVLEVKRTVDPLRSLPVGKWILAAGLAIAVAGFFYYDLGRYLSFEALKTHRDSLLALTEANYGTAVAAFIISYALITAVSLPGAAIMTLAGGFLFGSVLGTLYVNIAATSGATLAFLAARYLLREWVETKFGQRMDAFQRGFAENAFNYLMTLRLIPIFPFFLVNLLCGLTRIRLSTYMLATAIGIVPGSFVYAYAGRQLGGLNSMADIATPGVLLAFTLLGLLALAPVLYHRLRSESIKRE
ncbi:MAG: TVP38/TMEM64 family protein [Gammaproteobacteria bacterium]